MKTTGPGGTSEQGSQAEFLTGAIASLAILTAVVPFGMLYGALAIEAGFTPWQTLLASGTIYAGASQYLMLEMLGQSLGPIAILLAMLAINFRHVLYSAALGRHLQRFSVAQKGLAFSLMVDPVFAAAEQRARSAAGLCPAWYFGYALAVYAAWMAANALGMVFGPLLPEPSLWGLDYVLPLYFLGVLMGFRTSPGFAIVLASSMLGSIAMHATVGPPYHILGGALFGLASAVWRAPATRAAARGR